MHLSEHDQIDALNEAVTRLRRERDDWRELAERNGEEAGRRAEELNALRRQRGAVSADVRYECPHCQKEIPAYGRVPNA